jgi:acetylornithine deacetylase/succinyl-diaminopimelate desuccinylase-like protein
MLRFRRLKPGGSLHRAKRTAARIALYTSLVITLLLGGVFVGGLRSLDSGAPIDAGWRQAPYRNMEEVLRLQDYIRIDTTPQTGSELAGAQYLASILEREGIPTEVIDMGGRKANLIAVLEGARPEALILHNHIDVDPIREPEKWTFPPFSGHIEAPWIYGRGAFDMKSVAIAQLSALVKLKRAGIVPTRRVIFLATSGEETGSREGTAWLLRERADLLASSWGALTEGGVVEARGLDDIKYWGTETAQKRFVNLLACSPSQERLEALRADIRERGQPATELRLTPEVAEFLDAYAPSRDLPLHRELLADPASFLHDRERFARLAPYQQGLFRDEISAFPVEAAGEDGGYQLRITLGLLPDSDPDRAIELLLPSWLTHGVKLVRLPDDGPATASPTDHPIFQILTAVLETRYGDVTSGPYFQGRSTNDSRLFRRYGIPSYGFTPFLAFSTDTVGIGGNNEGIALPAYLGGVELYEDLLHRLVVDPS